MIIKILTEHHLEFLSLTGCFTASYESTLVKMSNCLKAHAVAHILILRWLVMRTRTELRLVLSPTLAINLNNSEPV